MPIYNGTKRKFLALALSFGVTLSVLLRILITEDTLSKVRLTEYELIFFDMEPPDSYDPLDSDITSNLFVMRSLYATPLEITPNNVLTSAVLEKFSYDSNTHRITWVVKKGLKFSDNTEITPQDILFSVLRMAKKRPLYPVLKDIIGIKAWSNDPQAFSKLPEGITINKGVITISFIKHIENPLFRFALEIFSIIPKHTIDSSTNKLNCKIPPQSGFYSISSSTDKMIKFKLRVDPNAFHGYKAPSEMTFKYYHPADIQNESFSLSKNSLIFGNEFRLKSENLMPLTQRFKFKYLPSSLFRFFLINPNIPPFSKSECRLLFADAIRSVANKILGKEFIISGSLFPAILPGYLNKETLKALDSTGDKEKCLNELRNTPITWHKVKKSRKSFEDDLVIQALNDLGVKQVKVSEVESASLRDHLYLENKTSFLSAGSGFWAQDPLGDLQMFFSPGMHPLLKDTISNPNIKKHLDQLDNSTEITLYENFLELNKAVYVDSTLAVFMHTRRFYAANSFDDIRDLPQAVVAPAAWQVFNVSE